MNKELQAYIDKYQLTEKKLLLAVSGGVDSMVMLDAFRILKLNIGVAHLNHNLRTQSQKEANFLKDYCQDHEVPFFYKKLRKGPKSEASARAKRYKFLNETLEVHGYDYLLTAHHLNDQVETFFLKLSRGAGPVDLWGMQEKEGKTLRPFLKIPKSELRSYAKRKKLVYFEDETNQDEKYARNLIRKCVIPELEKINPNFLKTTSSTIELGQAEANLITNLAEQNLVKLETPKGLDLKKFKSINPFLKSELLKSFLEKISGQKTDRYRKGIEELLRIIETEGNKSLEIGHLKLKKEYDLLSLETKKPASKQTKLKMGEYRYNGFLIKMSKEKAVSGKNNILLPSALAYNLHIRTWKVGDKIETVSGTKKIQDLFTDNKIPKAARLKWPILVSDKEILWVPLLAKSKKHLKTATNKTIKIEVIDERTTL